MEVTTIEVDLTDDVVDIITQVAYRKVRPILDTVSLGIVEEAIENGDFDDFKSSLAESIVNSIFLEAIDRAIEEFDEADRSR